MSATNAETTVMPTNRAYATFQPTWQRFHEFAAPLLSSSGAGSAAAPTCNQQHHPYSRQYSHVYSTRLACLRQRCLENAKRQAQRLVPNEQKVDVVDRIIEIKEGTWSILVGTIVKEMDPKRRPSVSSTYNDLDASSFLFPSGMVLERSIDEEVQESLRAHLFDSEKGDILYLEDESGRVELMPYLVHGDEMSVDNDYHLDANKLATGVVASVVGKVSAHNGVMNVQSIHFAGPPPYEQTGNATEDFRGPVTNGRVVDEPALLLISGLACGSDSPTDVQTGGSLALRREMLLEFLTNANLGNGPSICRIIVAGGGVAPPMTSINKYSNIEHKKSNGLKSESTSGMAFSLKELDLYFSEILSSGIPIDYIPGWHDPTNANWPQRPIHSCLLPHSSSFVDLFCRSSNPYESVLGGRVRVLGSDGLNVADLRRFLPSKNATSVGVEAVSPSSCIDALHQTLIYGHMAPTGPDSLPMFPSSESDPFVIKARPTIYFSGNSEKFETRLVGTDGKELNVPADGMTSDENSTATRLICIPSFALTGEVVVVKPMTLDCDVITFRDVRF